MSAPSQPYPKPLAIAALVLMGLTPLTHAMGPVETLAIHEASILNGQDRDADGYASDLVLSITLESSSYAAVYAKASITQHHLSYQPLFYTDDEPVGEFGGQQLFFIPIHFDQGVAPQWVDFSITLYDAYDDAELSVLNAYDFPGLADIAIESEEHDTPVRFLAQGTPELQVYASSGGFGTLSLLALLALGLARRRANSER